jgi:hypothetical protein
MTQISSTPALLPTAASVRPVAVSAEQVLKLLQSMEGLLEPGQSAKAEVMSLDQGTQSFSLMLRITLDSGRQAIVEAASSQPLEQGTALNVTAVASNRLIATLRAMAEQPLTELDAQDFPPGTLLQGKVGSSQPLDPRGSQATGYRIVVSLLNTAMAGHSLAIDSPRPIAVGSLLTARVQPDQQLAFMPLNDRLDQLEVDRQLTGQQLRQASLQGLGLSLLGLQGRTELQPGVANAVEQLLAGLPDVMELSDPGVLAQALRRSGLFLEAGLLAGRGDTAADLKANLLRLIAQLVPNSGGAPSAEDLFPVVAQVLPAFVRNALGTLGQSSARQQALSFPLPARTLLADEEREEGDLGDLLKLAAAAISRLQTHQLASLAQTQTLPDGTQLNTWQMEVPMRDRQHIVPLQARIQQEQSPPQQGREERESVWKVELAFDLAPLGPLQVRAQLRRGRLSSEMWAERSDTARLVEAELHHLREQLQVAGLEVDELSCRQGMPPQGARTSVEQRWVDETA